MNKELSREKSVIYNNLQNLVDLYVVLLQRLNLKREKVWKQ